MIIERKLFLDILGLIKQGKTDEVIALGSEAADPVIELASLDPSLKNSCVEILAELAQMHEDILQKLIRGLESEGAYTEFQIIYAEALGLVKNPKAIDALKCGLGHWNEGIGESCEEALITMAKKDENILYKLVKEFEKFQNSGNYQNLERWRYGRTLKSYIAILGKVKNPIAIDMLATGLKHFNPNSQLDFQKECVEALGMIGTSKSTDILINTLKCGDNKLKRACIGSLVEIAKSEEDSFQIIVDKFKASRDIGIKDSCAEILGLVKDKRAVETLIEGLGHPSARIRITCTKSLGMIRDRKATKALIQQFNGMDIKAYLPLSMMLRSGDPRALSPLTDDLLDSVCIKVFCAESLGMIGDKKAVGLLIIGLKHFDTSVVKACATALGLIKDPRAVNALIKGLTDPNFEIKKACIEALGLIGDRRATDSLVKLLKHCDWDIRLACARALRELGDIKSADALLDSLEDRAFIIREIYMTTLASMAKKDEKTFQKLIKKLETCSNLDVKQACAGALGLIGDSRAVELLIKELENKNNWEIKDDLATALGMIGDSRAVNSLIKGLTSTGYVNPPKACAEALEKIKDPRGIAFKKIIYDKSKEYISEIGMEKTRATIKEYLELIKNDYPKKELAKIKIELYAFFRETFEEESSSRIKMELPELKMKPPKRGPILYTQLKVAT
ncbi:MAG: HEAT repeat domain-containing protein [Candidatus Micrarchaeia archaeon]